MCGKAACTDLRGAYMVTYMSTQSLIKKNMFKKEINGKTNIKLLRGGDNIGFSFYIYHSHSISNWFIFF